MSDPIVVHKLALEIKAGVYSYIHFGITCSTWGNAGRLNRGTRRKGRPAGTPGQTLEREKRANVEAQACAFLCELCIAAETYFSIENPIESCLFEYEPIQGLQELTTCYFVVFDQCMYGLRPPGASPHEFVKKRTGIFTNMQRLQVLERLCCGISQEHRHVHAWGSVSVGGARVSRASAAGAYPRRLCRCWAAAVVAALDEDI